MRALEKDRNRRYGTPMELAADISRYLQNMPIVARPASSAHRPGNTFSGIASELASPWARRFYWSGLRWCKRSNCDASLVNAIAPTSLPN